MLKEVDIQRRVAALEIRLGDKRLKRFRDALLHWSLQADADGGLYLEALSKTTWAEFCECARQNPAMMKGIKKVDREPVVDMDGVVKGYVVTKIEFRDPGEAYIQLAKLQNWYAPKKIEVTGTDGQPLQLVLAPEKRPETPEEWHEMVMKHARSRHGNAAGNAAKNGGRAVTGAQ